MNFAALADPSKLRFENKNPAFTNSSKLGLTGGIFIYS
jgi:hypothetical protein